MEGDPVIQFVLRDQIRSKAAQAAASAIRRTSLHCRSDTPRLAVEARHDNRCRSVLCRLASASFVTALDSPLAPFLTSHHARRFWASTSVGETAKPTAAANPKNESILRREVISDSILHSCAVVLDMRANVPKNKTAGKPGLAVRTSTKEHLQRDLLLKREKI